MSMGSTSTDTHHLSIRRMRAEYLVAAQHAEPDRLKARLDEMVSHRMAQALLAMLAPQFATADPSVWLIRRLHVAVDVNAIWEPETLARAWAGQIGRGLIETLDDGVDGENVLWFPDRAAFLAHFLADVANGCAWGKWQYELFDGLRLLPTSATLRTAICDQPALGRAALSRLSAADLDRTLGTLTRLDARRILDHLSAAALPGDAARCWRAAWAAWDQLGLEAVDLADESRQALHLYLASSRADQQAGGPALRTSALAFARLARCLAHSSVAQADKLLAALAGADMAGLYAAVGAADAELLGPLLHSSPEWVRQVGQALLARYVAHAVVPPDTALDPQQTALGGLFLLLPLLDELPLAESTRGWPDAGQTTALALVRFLILIKCCGRARALIAFYDSLLRRLAGIAPGLRLADLAHWQRRVTAHNRRSFLETLNQWHLARGDARGTTYLLARVPARGATLAVLLDGERGVWRAMVAYRSRHPDNLSAVLQGWIARMSRDPAVILCDPELLDGLSLESPDCAIYSLQSDDAGAIAERDRPVGELLARLQTLPDDVAYLGLPPALGVAPALDRTFSVAAQAVLRAFAWRLPGFAFSSLPYLHVNFLDFAASVEDEPARRIVRLAKPPLHLVLNMTGLARATYRLSWLDERPFVLWPE